MFQKQDNTTKKKVNNPKSFLWKMLFLAFSGPHFPGNEYSCNLLVSHLKQTNKQKDRMAWQEFCDLCQTQLVLNLLLRSISCRFLCLWTWDHSLVQSKYNFIYTDLVALWDCLVTFLSFLSRWNYLLSCTKSCWEIAVPCRSCQYLFNVVLLLENEKQQYLKCSQCDDDL